MSSKEFDDKMRKVYEAIRRTYGYNDESDKLIDFIIDATDCYYKSLAQ